MCLEKMRKTTNPQSRLSQPRFEPGTSRIQIKSNPKLYIKYISMSYIIIKLPALVSTVANYIWTNSNTKYAQLIQYYHYFVYIL